MVVPSTVSYPTCQSHGTIIGRFIRSAAQKRHNQQQVVGLGRRQIRLHVNPIPDHQIRNLSNGQRYAPSLHSDIYFRTLKIKPCCIIGPQFKLCPKSPLTQPRGKRRRLKASSTSVLKFRPK